jgi:hypothetical protein
MKDLDYNDLITTKSGREEIINGMRGLNRSKGWAIVVAYLSRLRVLVQSQINNIDSPLSKEDLLKKRIELHYIDWLLNLPEELPLALIETDKQEDFEVEEMEVY